VFDQRSFPGRAWGSGVVVALAAGCLLAFSTPVAAQPSSNPTWIEDLDAGDWIRVELQSGGKFEGNYLGREGGAVRIQGDGEEIVIPVGIIHAVFRPRQAGLIGGIIGGVVGGVLLGGAGSVADSDNYHDNAHGGLIGGAIVGAAVGGALGYSITGSFTGWKRMYEQTASPAEADSVRRLPSSGKRVRPVYREVNVQGGFATNLAEDSETGTVGGRLAYYSRFGSVFAMGPDIAFYNVRVQETIPELSYPISSNLLISQVCLTVRGQIPMGNLYPYAVFGLGYRFSDYSNEAVMLTGLGVHHDLGVFRVGGEVRYNLTTFSDPSPPGVLAVLVGGGVCF